MSSSETPAKSPTPEQKALAAQWPSVSALAAPLVRALKADAQSLRLASQRLPNGCTVIDAGIAARGGIEAWAGWEKSRSPRAARSPAGPGK
jgi:hypothetical protein